MVRVRPADFSSQMAGMRKWLDEHRYEPARFTCGRHADFVVISVDFNNDAQAEAFEASFEGQHHPPEPDDPLPARPVLPNGDQDQVVITDTMAQVCWWRLMAEEVRAEADGFASTSAKETMEIVAQTWDSMAENLERWLAKH